MTKKMNRIEVRKKRLEIIHEISYLQDTYCKKCELSTIQKMAEQDKIKHCNTVCNIGQRLQGCGIKLGSEDKRDSQIMFNKELSLKITGMYQFYNSTEISNKLNLNRSTVRSFLKRWKISNKIIDDYYKYDAREILDLHHKGMSNKDIETETGQSRAKVWGVINREYDRKREGLSRYE